MRTAASIRWAGMLVALLAFPTARAQHDSAATARTAAGTRALCWRPRPAPRCRAYLVTEFGYERALVSSRVGGFEPDPDFRERVIWAVGPMINRGPSAAWGGVVTAVLVDDQPEGAGLLRAEARHRRWIGPSRGVDFSAGVSQKLVRTEGREPARAYGLTASVGVEAAFLGADIRVDALRGGGRPRAAALLGVHLGSYAAPVATLIAALVGLRSMPD